MGILERVGRLIASRPTRPSNHERLQAVSFELPDIESTVRERSGPARYHAGPYRIDLDALTCSCSDFRGRSREPLDVLARCCSHLLRELDGLGALSDVGEWERAIISAGRGAPLATWHLQLVTAPRVLIATTLDRDWINVFARRKKKGERNHEASGGIREHGWSIEHQRWSYGEGPPGAGELRKILKEMF